MPNSMQNQKQDPEMERALGWYRSVWTDAEERAGLRRYLALQLASAGLASASDEESGSDSAAGIPQSLMDNLREKSRLLSGHRAPVDQRIEAFLNQHFSDLPQTGDFTVPSPTLSLDRHGMSRELSLPRGGNHFSNSLVETHRLDNGILNNPVHDRRTTQGTFHIVEGPMAIPGDKRAVPRNVFASLYAAAMKPPRELMLLPYTSESSRPSYTWVSILLRPLVCPEVKGHCGIQTSEVRFFVPGSLVSNLDFVESIFGNAGDPLLPSNDAALDVEHWSGHSGCVILAPHLTKTLKKDLGLPHISEATDRQKKDRMCWESPDECYNDGVAFKLTCRDETGTTVTLIADNYYGYCKKEVKTQISFAANLMGGVEEEHAGGALAFASYSLGDEFQVNSRRYNGRTFADVSRDYDSFIDIRPEGYGVDRNFASVLYIPENANVSLNDKCVSWTTPEGRESKLRLSPDNVYIAPSGYKIQLQKHPAAPSWRLVGTVGEGVFCHKPCTVSGGGKSEISKSLSDYMIYGPIFVADQKEDFKKLEELFARDYTDRWNPNYADAPVYENGESRTLLDPRRSLGSTIKLLTIAPEFNDDYNAWLATIPNRVYAMALIIKRFIKPGMEDSWQDHFGVDIVNGSMGHELKLGDRPLVGTYLRAGLTEGRWRTFKLRQDFMAAAKVQREDDITVSTVLPSADLSDVGPGVLPAGSYKFAVNCEYRLFQRPDDAVHRGLDQQTELELSQKGNFISNFQPLDRSEVREIVDDVIEFDQFSKPMRKFLKRAAEKKSPGFAVCSSHPRLVDGKPTKNPRYLQDRPDLVRARETYIAEIGTRFHRAIPMDQPVHTPVGAVLSGRRNNPPNAEQGIRSLAVYGPLHYQELPELMMDYISSLTGKSPSTTGAGSEGALTKGPFNSLMPTIDLNASLVGMILTGLGGFSTPAGHIGPNLEVGHDISLLIPEVWCRMGPEERDPKALLENGMLEKIEDFEHNGQPIPAGRLGFRINGRFLRNYLSRVFDNPSKVFTDDILRPELQDPESYADGILHIAEAQQKAAQRYVDDGSFELACPPLQAILKIMAEGNWYGHDANSPTIRNMFTREGLLSSDWYRERLKKKQEVEIRRWQQSVAYLESFIEAPHRAETAKEMRLASRLTTAKERLAHAQTTEYLDELVGTIGADPMTPMVFTPDSIQEAVASK